MKKFLLIGLLIAGVCTYSQAQNRSINFEQTKEWKKIVRKAKKEKKLIFVDCYTSWCGPCKILANNVFTQDSVADYYNSHFVNAKFDMEKDTDGVKLKTAFDIKAFPTLVFVDPTTEEIVHRLVGAGTGPWLIAGGIAANDPQNNLKGLTTRYNAGERSANFLSVYLKTLASAGMQARQGEVASAYLNAASDEELATEENWALIKNNLNDPLSKPLRSVMVNRDKFYHIAGKDVVDQKLDQALMNAVFSIAFWNPETGETFNEERNKELISYLQQIDFYNAPAYLAYLYTAEYKRKGDYRNVLNSMHEAYKYNVFRRGNDSWYFRVNIEAIGNSKDSEIVQDAIKWIDQRCVNTNNYFEKANLMDSKSRVLSKTGDTKGAEQAKADEKRYNDEGVRQSGGRMSPQIRMN